MSAYTQVVAFIDWNSQLRAYADDKGLLAAAKHVLNVVGRRLAQAISEEFPSRRFVVDLRAYHGWHKGFEPTENRKAFATAVASVDFASLSPRPSVVFSGDVAYGDSLCFALPRRTHARLGIHLPNTVRSQHRQRELVEKMVDTALASDVVCHAAQNPDTWIVVMAEDDDFVPPLFAAEALLFGSEARVMLLRRRKAPGPFLKLDEILKVIT